MPGRPRVRHQHCRKKRLKHALRGGCGVSVPRPEEFPKALERYSCDPFPPTHKRVCACPTLPSCPVALCIAGYLHQNRKRVDNVAQAVLLPCHWEAIEHIYNSLHSTKNRLPRGKHVIAHRAFLILRCHPQTSVFCAPVHITVPIRVPATIAPAPCPALSASLPATAALLLLLFWLAAITLGRNSPPLQRKHGRGKRDSAVHVPAVTLLVCKHPGITFDSEKLSDVFDPCSCGHVHGCHNLRRGNSDGLLNTVPRSTFFVFLFRVDTSPFFSSVLRLVSLWLKVLNEIPKRTFC